MVKNGEVQSLLRAGCSELDLDVDGAGLVSLEKYFLELIRWSRKMNLIGKNQDTGDIIANHFLDSLVLLPYLRKKQSFLVDIGSGADFPGLVCNAVAPEMVLKMVEPRLKRVSFLRHLIRRLHLKNAEVVAERVENVAPESLVCSHIVSRAVADIADFLLLVEGIIGATTEVICMKGPRWEEELTHAQPVIERLHLKLIHRQEFSLPYSGKQRVVLIFNKRLEIGE